MPPKSAVRKVGTTGPAPKKAKRSVRSRRTRAAKQASSKATAASGKRATKASSNTDRVAGDEAADALRDFGKTTSRIVQQAASILEEEIAAGIVAAQRIENKFVDVAGLRSGRPDELLSRFRRDAHEVIDILVDLAAAAARTAGKLGGRIITIDGSNSSRKAKAATDDDIPLLAMPDPIAAGESAQVPMALENNGDKATDQFSFVCSPLMSPSGGRIDSRYVTFDPPTITLVPGKQTKVDVTIEVPARTPPGSYSGLLQSNKLKHLRAVLTVEVE